jgi:hypothetical protein
MNADMENEPGHVCDWRYFEKHGHQWLVICIAPGHDINYKIRMAPRIPDEAGQPRYKGELDV